MNWKNVKLGKKFFLAFGSVVIFLIVVAFWAINGIGNIIGNAGQVIDGNKLRTDLEHKYVQHLLWSQEVNKLLTDENVNELKVQTDYTKCDFGKWYYGEGKNNLTTAVPQLGPILKEFEQPHIHLHESAIKIKDVYQPGDFLLSSKLQEAKSDHLTWAGDLSCAFTKGNSNTRINVQKDHTLCRFGKWLNSDELKEHITKQPGLKLYIDKLIDPHEKLHATVNIIENFLKKNEKEAAMQYYNNRTQAYMKTIIEGLNEAIAWNENALKGAREANYIYNTETMQQLTQLGKLFGSTIEQSKNYIMTDDVMLAEGKKTRSGVLIFSIIATILAIIMAYIISSGILKPIKQGVQMANEVSQGNLAATINVDQHDEIGDLIRSLKLMVEKLKEIVINIRTGADNIAAASQQLSAGSQQLSQGASEQASSVEEVSSSMEEMTANIQQNSENAQQTELIAKKASDEIKKGSKATEISAQSMKEIAEKISIINEIAFQTNILALNAAVEAARAGEHGKGFAVVAAEVRKLAERSKIAAQEIDEVSKSGVKISEEAGNKLSEIVPEIEKTAQLVQEITASSHEQNSGAEQVNNAIQQINQSTQQNAASSEEMATNAEELASQAAQLREMMDYFKIDDLQIHYKTQNIKKQTDTKKKEEIKQFKEIENKEAREQEEFIKF